MRSIGTLFLATTVATASLFLSTPASGAQTSVSAGVGGVMAFLSGDTGQTKDGRAFEALLVSPGQAAANPTPNGVDLTTTWAVLTEYQTHPCSNPAGATLGYCWTVICQSFSNPASWNTNASTPGAAEYYFDATCPDGQGYRYYRVTWDQFGPAAYDTYSQFAFGSAAMTDPRSGPPSGVSGAAHTTSQEAWSDWSVKGFDGKGFHTVVGCSEVPKCTTGTLWPSVADSTIAVTSN